MGTTVKKHKFNAVDAAIIIVIAAVIGAVVLFFTMGGTDTVNNTVKLEYVIELRTIRNEFSDNFAVGDGVVDSVAKYHLGEVIGFSVEPASYNGNDFSAGALVAGEYPEHSNVHLTVVSEATIGADGRYVLDGGYDISVGTTMYVRLPNYTGVGYCTQLSETEAE
ncbi:MAG: DUF4330 family protein [Clostridia bacterium]|nr:DUF4330 family protein [Clostridia bacterium]